MNIKKILIDIGTRGAGKSQKELGGLTGTIGKLGKAVNSAASAYFASRGLINGIQKSITLASKTEKISLAFDNLAKSSGFSANTLTKLQRATDGTVNSIELMTQANNAMLLGITDSEDQMAEMFDIAQRLASALGEDTAFGVQSLVTGLGRQSKLMLDNLGIMVDIEEAYKRYADSIGKSVKQLTDQDKKQAFVNETLRVGKDLVNDLGEETLTSADRMKIIQVQIQEVSTRIGESLIPILEKALPIIDKVSLNLKNTFSPDLITIEELNEAIKQIETQLLADANAAQEADQSFFQWIQTLVGGDKILYERLETLEAWRDKLVEIENQNNQLAKQEGEDNPVATPFIDFLKNQAPAFEAGYDEFVNTLVDIDMHGKERREQVWLATRAAFIRFTGDMIKTRIKQFKTEEIMEQASVIKAGASNAIKNAIQISGAVAGYIRSLFQTLPWFVAGPLAAAGGAYMLNLFKDQTANISKKGIKPFATGGDFITSGPQMIMVGDNPGGRERVQVTPLSSPNINGPQGVTINLQGNIFGTREFVRDTLIPEIQKAVRYS